MPKCHLNEAQITGIVTCVPTHEKCIDDEVELYGGNEKQIERLKKTIGLNKRRVVESGTTSGDLCFAAAEHLLSSMQLDRLTVDGVICVTQTPDHLQPCNAALLHGRLGLSTNCGAFDVGLGCSGYVYGLWLAHMMVSSGGCSRVLLLAGDTLSQLVHPQDRAVASLFGDGGSATLIERSEGAPVATFSLHTDGAGASHLIVPAGGARQPISEGSNVEAVDEAGNVRSAENLFMDGAEVFNFSLKVEPSAVREIAEYAGVEVTAIDYFVFHQANRYILTNIAKRLQLDKSKVPMGTVEQYGNQSSASIPSAICGELAEALKSTPAKRVLLSGFGVGLSWASALVDLSNVSVCELIEFSD